MVCSLLELPGAYLDDVGSKDSLDFCLLAEEFLEQTFLPKAQWDMAFVPLERLKKTQSLGQRMFEHGHS